MSKARVLMVTQELEPYTTLTEVSKIASQMPQFIQDQGMEIRLLMPRYGTINERRHRLHEVVRLSGMNIIVDDDDYPLIIKVASLPGTRLQVYFLDNEEFFKRKQIFADEDGIPFSDNADRMVFFCKGVLETVKKFGWPPDIVHCHGWMTSLIPFYIKTTYQNEPIFQNAKIIYSLYNHDMETSLSERFAEKASINTLEPEDLKDFQNGLGVTLDKGASEYVDILVCGSEEPNDQIEELVNNTDKPVVKQPQDEEEFKATYLELYQSLIAAEEEEEV